MRLSKPLCYALTTVGGLVVGGAMVGMLAFGPLIPPAGAVSSTAKTLAEIEPRMAINATNTPGDADSVFKITQAGSYYLTSGFTAPSGKHGIEIAADNVSIDLMGFTVDGANVTPNRSGILVGSVDQTDVSVRDGTVIGFRATGIDLSSSNSRVSQCTVRSCGNAIVVGYNGSVVSCTVRNNTVGGILVLGGGLVEGCAAESNTGAGGIWATGSRKVVFRGCTATMNTNGIAGGDGCVITDCSSFGNSAAGINGGFASSISNCSSSANTGIGISVGEGSMVQSCSARLNSGNGIEAQRGSSVVDCSARSNGGKGIRAFADSSVLSSNASSNSQGGIIAGSYVTISNCTASLNTGRGIEGATSSSITGCTASGNTSDGIWIDTVNTVTGNTCCSSVNGAGIVAAGMGNRLEGNSCGNQTRGIQVLAIRNMVLKNACWSNVTNWDVVAGNHLLVLNGTGAGAVVGSSGGVSQSTDPNSNYSF